MFEKHGPSRSIRKYVDFPPDLPYGGEHWHGDEQDFMGESKMAKYGYHIGDGPHNPCIGRGTVKIGLKLAVNAKLPEIERGKIGTGLAVVGRLPSYNKAKIATCFAVKGYPHYEYVGIGLHLAVKAYLFPPTHPIAKIGLALAVTGQQYFDPSHVGKIGLDLAVAGQALHPPYEAAKIGLHLAVSGQAVPPPYQAGDIGLHLAVAGQALHPPYEAAKIGLHLAVAGKNVLPPGGDNRIGLHLAVMGIAAPPDIDGPGGSCGAALVITPGTYGPYTISGSGTEHWFIWEMPAFANWHIRYTVTSGSGSGFYVYYGANCSALNLENSEFVSGCVTLFFTDTPHHYLRVTSPGMFGPVTYTVELGTGTCMGGGGFP